MSTKIFSEHVWAYAFSVGQKKKLYNLSQYVFAQHIVTLILVKTTDAEKYFLFDSDSRTYSTPTFDSDFDY